VCSGGLAVAELSRRVDRSNRQNACPIDCVDQFEVANSIFKGQLTHLKILIDIE
jgi:hypothetical protein